MHVYTHLTPHYYDCALRCNHDENYGVAMQPPWSYDASQQQAPPSTPMTTPAAVVSCASAHGELCLSVNGTQASLTPMMTHDVSSSSSNGSSNDSSCGGGGSDGWRDEYYDVCMDASRVALLAQRYNDYYELSFTLQQQQPPCTLTSSSSVGSNNYNNNSNSSSKKKKRRHKASHATTSSPSSSRTRSRPRNLMAVLLLPWGTAHYLGPVLHEHAVPSARLVARVPPQARLRVCVDACVTADEQAPWPCEMLLKEHVKTLLDHDEYCGSVASAHVQNLVRDLPFYASAMRRFRNWSSFVRHFSLRYGTWRLVSYTAEQHTQLQLSELTAHDELRLVGNRHARHYRLGDVQRDRVKLRSLLRLRALVLRAHTAAVAATPTWTRQRAYNDEGSGDGDAKVDNDSRTNNNSSSRSSSVSNSRSRSSSSSSSGDKSRSESDDGDERQTHDSDNNNSNDATEATAPSHDSSLSMSSTSSSSSSRPLLLTPAVLATVAASSSFRALNCINYLQLLRHAARDHLVLFAALHPVQVDVRSATRCSSASLMLQSSSSNSSSGSSFCSGGGGGNGRRRQGKRHCGQGSNNNNSGSSGCCKHSGNNVYIRSQCSRHSHVSVVTASNKDSDDGDDSDDDDGTNTLSQRTMPGRHGKQRVKRKKSKRLPVTEMERTLKNSIHGRKRNERQILQHLIPPRVAPKMNVLTLSTTLPMFQSPSPRPVAATTAPAAAAATENQQKSSNKDSATTAVARRSKCKDKTHARTQ